MRAVFDDLDTFWSSQTLSIKYYPGCHYFQTACEAFSGLIHGKNAAAIQPIDVASTKLACEASVFGAEYRGAELRPIDVNFELTLTLTLAVLAHAGLQGAGRFSRRHLRAA